MTADRRAWPVPRDLPKHPTTQDLSGWLLCGPRRLVSADPQLAESVSGEADLVLVKPISFGQLRDLAHRLIR